MNAIVNQRAILDRRTLLSKIKGIFPQNNYDPTKRDELLSLLKRSFDSGFLEIESRFDFNKNGLVVLKSNSFLVDQVIRVLFEVATTLAYTRGNPSTAEKISLVAVGGYGREELAPYSDIDIMFLHPYKKTPYIEQVVEFLLYFLWDLGLKVGHSTRSIDDCIRLSKNDLIIQTSLLDSRWLWGYQKPYLDFVKAFQEAIINGNGSRFVEAKLKERNQRHEDLGDVRYVLEPNIKDGKGGLRDLQTLFWITKHIYGTSNLAELAEKGVFLRQDVSRFRKALEFYASVRCNLHYLARRPEERITFDIQKTLGEKMRYKDGPMASGVESFMKDYFLVAKDVGDLTRILCALLEEQQKKRPLFEMLKLSTKNFKEPGLLNDRGRVSLIDQGHLERNPVLILKVFSVAQKELLDVHPYALRLISSNLGLIDDALRKNQVANQLFLEMLTSPTDPETTLRRLNESGVFGKFVLEFGKIVAQMEFSMYHSYTVDEHTIRAIGVLSKIESGAYKNDMPNVTRAMNELQSRNALYFAVFLHDIAKGQQGDHSFLGSELAITLCPRFGLSEEETDTVAWLVREHLTMSNTAFKRDLEDPDTIKIFASIVKTVERLKLLTVLTCADIKAVGPKTWTSWKSRLLRSLYTKTLEHLSGDMLEENTGFRIQHAKDILVSKLKSWQKEAVETHITTCPPKYWLKYDHETHLRHFEAIRRSLLKNDLVHIEHSINDEFEYSEITVIAPDKFGLFSKIASVLALYGVNVVDAKIITLGNGKVIDSLSFLDGNDKAVTNKKVVKNIICKIEEVLLENTNLNDDVTRIKKNKRSKRKEAFSVASRVILDNNTSSEDTIIEVTGHDRVGLLYDITSALTSLNLKISSAHVTTFGVEAVDNFYVKDRNNEKLRAPEEIAKVKKVVLEAVNKT